VLDLSGDTWQWREVQLHNTPTQCVGRAHSATRVGWKLLLYGGLMEGQRQSSVVMVLDTRTWTWSMPPLARQVRLRSLLKRPNHTPYPFLRHILLSVASCCADSNSFIKSQVRANHQLTAMKKLRIVRLGFGTS
jgi:hypothetical protein